MSDEKQIEQCFKNKETDSSERVIFNISPIHGTSCSYWSADTSFVHVILKQIQKQQHLIFKDPSREDTYYQFGDDHFEIRVDIRRKAPFSGKVDIIKK
ncbi:MAG TPA: hypothetical protein VFE53_14800 [Mucilaginibacter sp.]|nr:hypothetical protein [Mucilaginibacter sp.]